jgi:hypothetical protein
MLKKYNNDDFLGDTPFKKGFSDKDESLHAHAHLFPIDESEEFHDPFSDLSLFLAKKIKAELSNSESPKKWSRNIQVDLLKSILPDFNKKFPKYRLGNNALKKTWDKVSYYLQFIQKQKQSLTEDGKLNVNYLIQQNLKNLLQNPLAADLHPYTTAHNLAVKISECVATIDCERVNLETLTKKIWAIQKHLTPKSSTPSPFDRYDGLDKLIVRYQLEEIAKNPKMSAVEVFQATEKKIEALKLLSKTKSTDHLLAEISSLLAEKLYPHLNLQKKLSEKQFDDLILFITNQLNEQKELNLLNSEKDCNHAAEKLLFLYKLASHLTEEETKHNLQTALDYVYNLAQSGYTPQNPVLKAEVFTFIDAEISNLKEKKCENPLEQVLNTLMKCFSEAKNLPKLELEDFDEVEICIWKVMSEVFQPNERISNHLKETLSLEIANIYLDHTKESFKKLISITISYLKKIHLTDTSQLSKKSEFWSHQNDMLCKFLHFEENTPLLKLISRIYKAEADPRISHTEIVEKAKAIYLKNNALIHDWTETLEIRLKIMYKYFWYNQLGSEKETSYDRFLKWHLHEIMNETQKEFEEIRISRLEERVNHLTPLAPFTEKHAKSLCI